MTDDQTPPELSSTPLYLSNDPACIAAFLKKNRNADSAEPESIPYDFSDFIADMNMTDFEDPYQIRAILESQAHLLGAAFHYLMLEGDLKNLDFILRTQRIMRDTLKDMNSYPQLSYCPAIRDAKKMD